jgi:hypothetical protein
MKAEKVILSIFAVIVGLIAAGVAFYLYQMTKTLPPSKQETLSIKSEITPSPTPNNEYFLTIENPKDEAVVNSKSVTISGKTSPNATIIVSTATNDQVVTPAENGNFTLNDTIGNGTNLIQITAVFPTGEEKTETRTVVYTTESF